MIEKIRTCAEMIMLSAIFVLYLVVDYRGDKIESLSTDLRTCENEMEKNIQAGDRADKTIEKIRTVVKTVKSPCDCYNGAIDSAIIGRVRGE